MHLCRLACWSGLLLAGVLQVGVDRREYVTGVGGLSHHRRLVRVEHLLLLLLRVLRVLRHELRLHQQLVLLPLHVNHRGCFQQTISKLRDA